MWFDWRRNDEPHRKPVAQFDSALRANKGGVECQRLDWIVPENETPIEGLDGKTRNNIKPPHWRVTGRAARMREEVFADGVHATHHYAGGERMLGDRNPSLSQDHICRVAQERPVIGP